jgi:hypothetical protein
MNRVLVFGVFIFSDCVLVVVGSSPPLNRPVVELARPLQPVLWESLFVLLLSRRRYSSLTESYEQVVCVRSFFSEWILVFFPHMQAPFSSIFAVLYRPDT